MAEDYVEVSVQPSGDDGSFGIDLRVLDSTLDENPFDVLLRFQLEEDTIPGLNEDAVNDPDQIIDLAKGLLLCDSDELPLLGEIPIEDCPPNHMGFYYTLEIEMQITTDEGEEVVKEQQWQVSVLYTPTKNPVETEDLFQMIQDFFADHM